MITRPLDLESRLRPPPRDLDLVAWVNVGLIVLFFGLLGSRFVLAPGLVIGVADQGAADAARPASTLEGAGPASVVVTFRRDNVILFEGGMYSLPELEKQMRAYVRKHPGAVMQVNADRQVSWQSILALCDVAKSVGFANILIPTDSPGPAGSAK